jgi:hypothetical protein
VRAFCPPLPAAVARPFLVLTRPFPHGPHPLLPLALGRRRWPIVPIPIVGLPGRARLSRPPFSSCVVLVFPLLAVYVIVVYAVVLAVLVPVALTPRCLLFIPAVAFVPIDS